MPARKRILVVYYSMSGNTQRVAKDLAAYLGADLQRLRERTHRRGFRGYLRAVFDSLRARPASLIHTARDAAGYDLIIVGTPIWAGRITPAVRTYLESLRGRTRHVAFFTTSGHTGVDKVLPAMQRLVDLESIASIGFCARELRDAACYENKLTAFLGGVRPLAPRIHREPVHACV
jgi:flavodoxin